MEKEIRLMELLEDVDGRCSTRCNVKKGCEVVNELDRLNTIALSEGNLSHDDVEKLLCPVGLIIINGRMSRGLKQSDLRSDLP